MNYVLALDQGTTSSRALLINHQCDVVFSAQKEHTQFFPQTGWVEHSADEIWQTQWSVITTLIDKARATIPNILKQISAIGITNQRETTVVWNRKTGEPIAHAIVWQDRRTAPLCDKLKQEGWSPALFKKTGLILDPYFSATKLQWLLDHMPQARAMAERGELAFGTIDSWLLWKLTNGRIHATDVSNASRTLLWNINTQSWDEELLTLFNIPRSVLPTVCSSAHDFGVTSLLGVEIPITGMAGDQQAATFGQACWKAGMVKNTYGTGCFMLCTTGDQPVFSNHRLLTTAGWRLPQKPLQYCIEGSVFMGGAIIQWLRDGLKMIDHADEVESLASVVGDTDGVVLVPAFTGLGAPYWDANARGAILGMTRGTGKAHIARAALESIVQQVADVVEAMQADMRAAKLTTMSEMRVDGGASKNNLLMQMQADLLQMRIVRPKNTETTAMGAAFLAGLQTGFWKTEEDIVRSNQIDKIFEPQSASAAWSAQKREQWLSAINTIRT